MTSSRRSARSARPQHEGQLRAVAYLRVSTAEQADSGAGLDAQRSTVLREAQRRDWNLVAVEVDAGASGKSLSGRPALDEALDAVRSGRADVLVVAKLDRLSRSVADFAALLDRAQREGWGLVALDLGVDTTTPAGELVANVMAAVAQWERRTIGQRTKEGLAAKKASGVRLGRPAVLSRDVVQRICDRRSAGLTLQAIADELNAEGVPTARGTGPWRVSSVAALLRSGAATTAITDVVVPQRR
jgi:DNA invertase Pin-like site-specific DNA recombinase